MEESRPKRGGAHPVMTVSYDVVLECGLRLPARPTQGRTCILMPECRLDARWGEEGQERHKLEGTQPSLSICPHVLVAVHVFLGELRSELGQGWCTSCWVQKAVCAFLIRPLLRSDNYKNRPKGRSLRSAQGVFRVPGLQW